MITLSGSSGTINVVRARFLFTWTGVWQVDLDLDPGATSATVTESSVPSGPVTITITTQQSPPSTIVLNGTVDPTSVGRWVAGIQLKILAGGGGWGLPVPAQEFASSSGVSSLAVESATAAAVGERVTDPQPISLGLQWERLAGPASSIFTAPDRSWYVDVSGVTQVATWPAAQPDPSLQLLQWDPEQQRGLVAVDALILPGTVLTDARFDGPVTVRDVEQVWDKDGTRATVWCSTVEAPRLVGTLTQMVRALAGVGALKRYTYRIVSQAGPSSLNLQAVPDPNQPEGTLPDHPDVQGVPVWPMQGLTATYTTGSLCHVVFSSVGYGDPMVVAFEPGAAVAVQVNGGTNPTAILGSTVQTNVSGTWQVMGGVITGLVAPSGGGPVTGTPLGTIVLVATAPSSGTVTTGVSDLTLPSS